MESKAKIFGHPIHQMLIVFPLGLLAMAVIFDIIRLATHNGTWSTVSFYMIAAGVISGLISAVFGLIDYIAIPNNTRAKSGGATHGIGNVIVVLLFAVSWWRRRDAPADPGTVALVCSFVGAALALFTGWLGGELVDRLGIGVDPGAHPDAPSSMSGRPASSAG